MYLQILKDKIRGSLIGGAIGDALGYPVEFCNSKEILNHYGKLGITRFDLEPYWLNKSEHTGMAIVSDDTQMTMFTACGLVNTRRYGVSLLDSIQEAYLEWLTTQDNRYTLGAGPKCWITTIPEMNVRRAPGNTCLTSLQGIARKQTPVNKSKGCGGVMRIAPIPLYAAVDNRISIVDTDRLAGDVAQLTHHHPLGYIPAALMSHVIYRLVQEETPSRSKFEFYIREGMEQIKELYAVSKTSLRTMEQLVDKSLILSGNDQLDNINIEEQLGGGWVAEETLAIALYCIHRYFPTDLSADALSTSFERSLIASVNHSGDSDSTGAVTGNIIGSITGYDAIPQYYKINLEHHETILKLADELYNK
jgi:ADP-ribosylglycohydrolase